MPKRIIVNLRPEARAGLDALAALLADKADMRVGISFPRQGLIVGEVRGQIEIDRISAMAEVETVRIQAEMPARRVGRGAMSSNAAAYAVEPLFTILRGPSRRGVAGRTATP